MSIQTELGEVLPLTLTSEDTGRAYTSPFEVNVYGEAGEEGGTEPYIGRAMVLGALYEDGEEPMPVLEIDKGAGEKKVTIALFFGITPIEEDEVPADTPRMTYDDYMSVRPS